MKTIRKIELLAPAKNLECGIEAINHGADAVYIGAPRFGARAAAGNSLDDINKLVKHAHTYNARIYVTLNTILRNEELSDTEELIWQLYRIGVDALIIQDLGITQLHLPPIPLHASTQMDNRSVEKVKFLHESGFRQVVLARELTLEEIKEIHQACPETPLEVFVHGALCVSYSGQCYISQACYGRSANRGECAQFCRLAFNMLDADGRVIARNKHLLSLKDLNQSEQLEELLDAGVTSLKIEGRLKDVSYVKNVTASYRQKLDAIFRRRPEYCRASSGSCSFTFRPQLDKSFSRGFTHYFLNGRIAGIASPDTPKSLGELMGNMKEQRGGWVSVSGVKPFHNGDGVCFLDEQGTLQGFRINRVEGNKLFPAGKMPRIKPRTPLYRNYDQEFEKLLSQKSSERKLSLSWLLTDMSWGFSLTAKDEDEHCATLTFKYEKELARTPQAENLRTQLSKLGGTVFKVNSPDDITIRLSKNWFIPSSVITDWRRQVIERLLTLRHINYHREISILKQGKHPYFQTEVSYLGNVMNEKAKEFYINHGVKQIENAFEANGTADATLMFCRHCLRHHMGWCPKYQQGKSPYREPYYLQTSDGRSFRLHFDCKECMMKVVATPSTSIS